MVFVYPSIHQSIFPHLSWAKFCKLMFSSSSWGTLGHSQARWYISLHFIYSLRGERLALHKVTSRNRETIVAVMWEMCIELHFNKGCSTQFFSRNFQLSLLFCWPFGWDCPLPSLASVCPLDEVRLWETGHFPVAAGVASSHLSYDADRGSPFAGSSRRCTFTTIGWRIYIESQSVLPSPSPCRTNKSFLINWKKLQRWHRDSSRTVCSGCVWDRCSWALWWF